MLSIDLNCDLGEIEGSEGETLEAQLMRHVSSINVACGGHAGDADRVRNVVARALPLNLAIGAHPGSSKRTVINSCWATKKVPSRSCPKPTFNP